MPKDKEEKRKELKVWFFEFMDEYQERGFLKCPNCDVLFKPTKYPGCPVCGAVYNIEKKAWETKPKDDKPPNKPDGDDGDDDDEEDLF